MGWVFFLIGVVLSTDESERSSPCKATQPFLIRANICRLASGKRVFILRLCHFHYAAAVYRSTGMGIWGAGSPNAILNSKMLRRVTERPLVKTGKHAFKRMNEAKGEERRMKERQRDA